LRANLAHEALPIARQLFAENEHEAGLAFILPFALNNGGDPATARSSAAETLVTIANDLCSREHYLQAAALHYSSANVFMSLDRTRKAIKHYSTARRLDPSYLRRPYFLSELAGCLFLAKRFALSARYYALANELQKDARTRLLYADALMFSGRYREARDLFRELLQDASGLEDAEWFLKEHVLTLLLDSGTPNIQARARTPMPTKSMLLTMSDDDVVNACKNAIQRDALNALAWFNLGYSLHKRGDFANAAQSFLVAALANPGDVVAWVNATTASLHQAETELAAAILAAAHQTNGERFLLAMASSVPKIHQEMIAQLVNEIGKAATPKRDSRPVVRLHGPDGTWMSVLGTLPGMRRT
jgi:tetratricopeptide (TPR) repeat protein